LKTTGVGTSGARFPPASPWTDGPSKTVASDYWRVASPQRCSSHSPLTIRHFRRGRVRRSVHFDRAHGAIPKVEQEWPGRTKREGDPFVTRGGGRVRSQDKRQRYRTSETWAARSRARSRGIPSGALANPQEAATRIRDRRRRHISQRQYTAELLPEVQASCAQPRNLSREPAPRVSSRLRASTTPRIRRVHILCPRSRSQR